MKASNLASFILLLSLISSCASVPVDSDFDESFKAVRSAISKCRAVSNNTLIAQKECFPLLDKKELLVQIEKIEKSYSLEIIGHLGNTYHKFKCEIDKSNEEKYFNNPNLVQIGEKYILTAKFDRFHSYGEYATLYFQNCKFKKFSKES